MKVSVFLVMVLYCPNLLPYAFVHGSKSDYKGKVYIAMYKDKVGSMGDVIAYHEIAPGNKGRNAEWNWKSIEKQTGKKKGENLTFTISAISANLPRQEGKIASDGLFGFILKKDPHFEKYTVEFSQEAANEYTTSDK